MPQLVAVSSYFGITSALICPRVGSGGIRVLVLRAVKVTEAEEPAEGRYKSESRRGLSGTELGDGSGLRRWMRGSGVGGRGSEWQGP